MSPARIFLFILIADPAYAGVCDKEKREYLKVSKKYVKSHSEILLKKSKSDPSIIGLFKRISVECKQYEKRYKLFKEFNERCDNPSFKCFNRKALIIKMNKAKKGFLNCNKKVNQLNSKYIPGYEIDVLRR